jgi:hypothetical protein
MHVIVDCRTYTTRSSTPGDSHEEKEEKERGSHLLTQRQKKKEKKEKISHPFDRKTRHATSNSVIHATEIQMSQTRSPWSTAQPLLFAF